MDNFLAFHRKIHLILHIPSLGEIWKHTILMVLSDIQYAMIFHPSPFSQTPIGITFLALGFGFMLSTFSMHREEFFLILSCDALNAYSLKQLSYILYLCLRFIWQGVQDSIQDDLPANFPDSLSFQPSKISLFFFFLFIVCILTAF